MTIPYIDTDIIIRLLTKDDPLKHSAVSALFDAIHAGEMEATAPVTVIADAVHVLSSRVLYHLPRSEISAMLSRLVLTPNLHIADRSTVLRALDIFGSSHLDFGDAYILAAMERTGSQIIYSYDRDFDRIAGIQRMEPPLP